MEVKNQRRMAMPEGEIITSFKQAKDQDAQIGILADLNGCSRDEMAMYLFSLDLLPELPAPTGQKPLRIPPAIDELRALQLLNDGLSDLEIAEMLGVSENAFKVWRRSKGYMKPRGGASQKKKEPAKKEPKPPKPPKAPKKPAPAGEPRPDAALPDSIKTVDDLLSVLSDIQTRFPGAAIYLEDRAPMAVLLSALYRPAAEVEVTLVKM